MTLIEDLPPGPESFPVAVLMRRKPSTNRWLQYSWQVLGVVVNSSLSADDQGTQVRTSEKGDDGGGGDEFLWGGLSLTLYKDEAESYYHNLMAPEPQLYVIIRRDDQNQPQPFIVSACFDEANSHTEVDEEAYPVPMPKQLYGWVEQFVLKHYVPEERKKRKRKNWKDSGEFKRDQ